MDAEGLGGERDLPHRLSSPRLGGKRDRALQQLCAISTDSHGELEAGKQDTDDHANTCSHLARTDRVIVSRA
jgi:hypothetical protein